MPQVKQRPATEPGVVLFRGPWIRLLSDVHQLDLEDQSGIRAAGTAGLNPMFKSYQNVDDIQFWKSKTFKTEFCGMDIGDVDGDGQNEIVLGARTEISVYRFN